jgi:GMP synthase (glutamine-hydrolysing)
MKTTPRRSSRGASGAGGEQRRRDPGKAPILVVQPELDDPPHLFGEWLAEAGATLEVVHPYAGDAVPTLDGYAALLVLGGAPSANDDEVLTWIGPVKELIRDAVAEGVPTLGICLGHQLMGAALGGTVTPNPRGQQTGLLEVGWTEAARADRLFAGLATPRRGVQWNYDLVVEPPAGAVVLAETGAGEAQVVRYAPDAWGVQLHPEVDEAIVGTWVTDAERSELAGRGLDADALLLEIKEARAELDQAWAPLAAGFVDVAAGRTPRTDDH